MLRFFLVRRIRARYFRSAWYSFEGTRYLNICVASPNAHRWWAFDLYIYFS